MENKKSFILFVDHVETIKELTDEEAGKLFKAINDHVHNREIKLEGIMKALFIPFQNSIDREAEKYKAFIQKQRENGAKGGRPKKTQAFSEKPKKPKPFSEKPKKSQKSLNDNDNDNDNDKKELSKDNLKKDSEYGNPEINNMLKALSTMVGVDQFKETQKTQRMYGKHFCNLLEKIGKQEFRGRLESILSDDFKKKNANSLKYLYSEVKSYIHSPIVQSNKKGVVI